jgi:hypothetical protein
MNIDSTASPGELSIEIDICQGDAELKDFLDIVYLFPNVIVCDVFVSKSRTKGIMPSSVTGFHKNSAPEFQAITDYLVVIEDIILCISVLLCLGFTKRSDLPHIRARLTIRTTLLMTATCGMLRLADLFTEGLPVLIYSRDVLAYCAMVLMGVMQLEVYIM